MTETLELKRLLDDAQRETGLTDWGEPDLTRPLGILLKSLNDEVQLSAFGRSAFESRIRMHLRNRLLLQEDRMRRPEIALQRIERPVFITGLPRSGTSFLLEVLAQDPANRFLATWEILQPSPPPTPDTYDDDPRIEQVQHLLKEQGYLDDDLQATHPFGATLPEECVFIFEQTFICTTFATYVPSRQYGAWMATPEADPSQVYAFHRRFLQHLQSRIARDRWVLKSPVHLFQLDALFGEYPDARIVWTHRDLSRCIPSIASMATILNDIFNEGRADPRLIAQGTASMLAHSLDAALATRDKMNRPNQFRDVLYEDLRLNPITVVEGIYRQFEIDLSEPAREAMISYITKSGKEKHGHGRHRYEMSDFGLTRRGIEETFRNYLDRYKLAQALASQ